MGKHIVVINKEGEVQKKYSPISPRNKHFTEDLLQKLIFKEPRLLPTEEIDSDFKQLIPIEREIPVKSGSIDVLYITPEGKICIVETKLWRNSQAHREVVAQIIDYTKDLADMSFRSFSETVGKNRIKGEESETAFFNKVRKEYPDFNETKLKENLIDSLSHGRFLLLIVGDEIYPQVAFMVDSIQSAPHLEFVIALAELRFYNLGDSEDTQLLVVPQVVGKNLPQIRNVIRIIYVEEKPTVRASIIEPPIDSLLDRDLFIATLDFEGRAVFNEIFKLYETHGFPINYGSTGFSLNANVDGNKVHFLEGHGSKAAKGQSLTIFFATINKKIQNGKEIEKIFRYKLRQTGIFRETERAMNYKFEKKLNEKQIDELIKIIIDLANQLEINGMIKEKSLT